MIQLTLTDSIIATYNFICHSPIVSHIKNWSQNFVKSEKEYYSREQIKLYYCTVDGEEKKHLYNTYTTHKCIPKIEEIKLHFDIEYISKLLYRVAQKECNCFDQ